MSEPCDTSLNGRNFLSPIVAAYQRLEGWLQKILGGRRAILIGAGMAVVCSIFMACPNWGKVSVLTYYLQKASDPWTALGEPESHEAKLTYRLTGALIAHHLGLAEKGHVVMMACCTVLLLLAVMAAAARITRDNVTAFFITSAVAWTHAGSAGLATGLFPYDPLGYLLVVLPFVWRNAMAIFVSCLLANWTDERAFVATSFAALYYGLIDHDGRVLNRRSLAVIGAGVLYLAGRFTLGWAQQYPDMSAGHVLVELKANSRFLHFCAMYALEGLWLVVIVAVMAAGQRKKWGALLGLTGLIGAQLALAFVVNDLTRAAAYVLPATFPALGLILTGEQRPVSWLRPLTCVAAVVSAMGLNYFVISWSGTDRCIFHPTLPFPLRVVEWIAG